MMNKQDYLNNRKMRETLVDRLHAILHRLSVDESIPDRIITDLYRVILVLKRNHFNSMHHYQIGV